MELYDKCFFDDVVLRYEQKNISKEEYESIYTMFQCINQYTEVKLYLYTMRFLGLGTEKEEDVVLEELEQKIRNGEFEYSGLYYDMLLYKNAMQRVQLIKKISQITNYDSKYMKDCSYLTGRRYNANDFDDARIEDLEWEDILERAKENDCEKVIVTLGQEPKTVLHEVYSADCGFVSQDMITNNKLSYVEYTDCIILIYDGIVDKIISILPLLECVVESGKCIVVLARHFDDEVIKTINVNTKRGTFKVCLVEADIHENAKLLKISELLDISKTSDIYDMSSSEFQKLSVFSRVMIYCDKMYIFRDSQLLLNKVDMSNLLEVYVEKEDILEQYEGYLKLDSQNKYNNVDNFINYIADKKNSETIVIKRGLRTKTYKEELAGVFVDAGYVSQDIINCIEQGFVCLEYASLLLIDGNLDTINKILPILESVVSEKGRLILISSYFSQEVIDVLLANIKNGTLQCGYIKVDSNRHIDKLADLLNVKKYTQDEIWNINNINDLEIVKEVYIWADKCCILPFEINLGGKIGLDGKVEFGTLTAINAGGINLEEQNDIYNELVGFVRKYQI